MGYLVAVDVETWIDRPGSWPFWVAQFDPFASPASRFGKTHDIRAATRRNRRDLVTTAQALPARVSTIVADRVRKLSSRCVFLRRPGGKSLAAFQDRSLPSDNDETRGGHWDPDDYLRKTGAKTSSPPSKRTAELPARGAVATTVTGSNRMNIMRPHAVPQTPKTQRKRAIPTTHISKLSRVKRIASKKRGRTVDPRGP